jgi:asparagine synthase (glutamine-hydrolysing)
MCGICGIIQSDENKTSSQDVLQAMARLMKHRGPDDEGYHAESGASLGFRRLSIIDLAGGHQPMSNEDDSLWITFNGEIYNFQELRARLESSGKHRFKTRSDTETILHLYEEYGEECLQHLRGMFALAIWDRKKRKLFAARDRFGKKPFYYFESPKSGLVFASELKSLKLHPDCPTSIRPEVIQLFLSLQYIPAPYTIYQDVHKLPAAHYLTWTKETGVRTKRYWDLRYEPKESLGYPEAQERLRARMNEAVKLRMISDVPLGAFLSGGIDSSVVVALMAQQSNRPIQTFSIGFEEADFSELPYARAVAERYKTDHHEFIVKPHLIDILPKLAWFYSEPYADSSALPSYYLARETRQHVTVALNGDGGDEVFGGYLRYRAMWAMQWWNKLPSGFRQALSHGANKIPSSNAPLNKLWRLQRILSVGALDSTKQYLRTMDYFHPEELDELWSPEYKARLEKTNLTSLKIYEDTLSTYSPTDVIDRLMYLDLHHYLPDCLMVKMDIATMANSLETRSPFLDHVLVEEVAKWPSRWKYQPPNTSKRIIKETFAKDLPSKILNRGKQGFGVPISKWFQGPLREYLREHLLSPQALGRGIFHPKTLGRYIDEHQSGKKDRAYGLWALLMLELWLREFESKGS